MKRSSKKDIEDAKEAVISWLHGEGINDDFIVKIMHFPDSQKNWMAKYRARSQFTSKPIFWINEDLSEKISQFNIAGDREFEIITDSLVHEYAHVIGEWLHKRDPDAYQELLDEYDDEENFAETFAMEMKDNMLDEGMSAILSKYKRSKWGSS